MSQTPTGQTPIDLTGNENYFLKLRIGNADISPSAVSLIVIREWIFDIFPRIELTITDDGTLFEVFNLKDETEIFIEIGKNRDDKHIISKFLLDNYTVDVLAGNGGVIFTINGILKAPTAFYPIKTRSFSKQPSRSVLSQIGTELGLKVQQTQNLSTQDAMKWLQINSTNFDMIQHVLDRSNIKDDILFSYADVYGNFNITSFLNKANQSDSKTAQYSVKNGTADVFQNQADANILWYVGYKVENIQGYYNKKIGYGMQEIHYNLSKGFQRSLFNTSKNPLAKNINQTASVVDSYNGGYLPLELYPDYYQSMINNKYLQAVNMSQRMVLRINSISDVRLFDKVNVMIPSLIKTNEIQEIYSGDWLVCGIMYKASKGGLFEKELSLHRNGYGDSDLVKG